MVLISGDSSGIDKSLSRSTKQLNTFQKASSSAAKALTASLAAVSFASLGKEIIQITSEFQKFEAVLTNTLGSKSEAQKALKQIQEFAAKTPFSVQELTASFVKLANQGFQPTGDEMRKLGDLAASTGKSFDQLTEAIIDAQTGEFERLKEFGIRASKSGDQVKFTFKGVQTQAEFTADSIREYLLSLGDLEGVSGSMAAISATLGGSISNLGDTFDNLLLTLGNLTSGPLKDFIDILQGSLKTLTDDIAGNTGATTRLETINQLYVESAQSIDDINKNLETLNRLKKEEDASYDSTTEKLGDYKNQINLTAEEFLRLGKDQSDAKEYSEAYGAAIEALTSKLTKLNEKTTEQVGLIPSINAQIKIFEDLKNKAFNADQIGRFNVKIEELRDELALLNATGRESGFLKNLNAGVPTAEGPSQPTAEGLSGTFPTTIDINNQPYLDKLKETADALNAFGLSEEELIEQSIARQDALIAKQIEQADAAQAYGQAIGDSLGQAVAGQITFAQAMKKITADLVKMFLQRALAGIISSAATSGGPPPVAIALALAGVAAISAMFSKIGASGGSSGSSGISSQASKAGRTNIASASEAQDVKVSGSVQVRGQDIWITFKNYEDANKFLKAGG